MTVPAYAVHPIPSVPSDHHIARYKEVRLKALQTNPECFSSTYDSELSMGYDAWKARLHSRDKVTFVAVRTSTQEFESDLLSSPDEWVGTVTVIGPDLLRQHAFNPPENIHSVEGNESYYIFAGVWVHPNHRMKGIGKKLVNGGMDWAKAYHDGLESTNKRTLLPQVGSKNKSAIDLYSAMGFNCVESKERDAEDIVWMCKTLHC